jgi:hypothetical protein
MSCSIRLDAAGIVLAAASAIPNRTEREMNLRRIGLMMCLLSSRRILPGSAEGSRAFKETLKNPEGDLQEREE